MRPKGAQTRHHLWVLDSGLSLRSQKKLKLPQPPYPYDSAVTEAPDVAYRHGGEKEGNDASQRERGAVTGSAE